MILGNLLSINRDQRGITLAELMIALCISGLVLSGIAMGISLTTNTSARNSNHTVVLQQAQNAMHWIEQDVRMAQEVDVDSGDSGFPLTLTWVDWDGTEHQIIYSVEQDKLKRSYSIDSQEPNIHTVAEYVDNDSAATNCQLASGTLTFEVTITLGSGPNISSKTVTFQGSPRAGL